ncbi:hypothetical protein EWM64_g6332 [Hericium alpestre]|uniref:F-box domain-containing protein n=1 Tax=Hericium alpestre TaxID=135208 RepID=A0A4Y9ZUZ4_9AGAM|nr:hypothetical protein EWM64_g6332 [Hericium alpestre]
MAASNEVDPASNRTSSAQYWGSALDFRLEVIQSVSANGSREDTDEAQQFIADECDSGEQLLGWIGATHVCRSWREAALQHSRLWANLTFRFGVRWFAEMVSSVKSSSLAFTMDEYLPPSFKAPDLSLPLIQPVQHVGVAALDQQLDTFASFLTMSITPLLETFSMERRDGSQEWIP